MGYSAELAQALLPTIRTKLNTPIYDWAEDNITLVGTIEGLQGSKSPNFKDFPDIKQFFDFLQNPDVKEIVLMFSAQTGKTFPEIIGALWFAVVKGYNVMFALCDDNKKTKVYERIKSINKANKDFLGWDDSRGATKGPSFKYNSGGAIHMVNLNSPSDADETPADVIFTDEWDPYVAKKQHSDTNMLDRFSNRIQARPHGKMITSSTPSVYSGGGGILDEYQIGRRYVCQMKCVKCGEFSEFKITDIHTEKFDENDTGQIKAKKLGYAICPKCEKKLTDKDHYIMSRNALQIVEKADENKTMIRVCLKKAVWNSLIKPWSSFAYEHERAKQKGASALAELYNSKCADPQSVNVKYTTDDYVEMDYKKGYAPPECQFLTFAVDVGAERIHITTMGYGSKDRAYLVDWEEFAYGGRANFIEVENKIHEYLFNKVYRTTDNRVLKVVYGAIDSNYHESDVFRLCEKYKQLIPLVGNGKLNPKWQKRNIDPDNSFGFRNKNIDRFVLNHGYFQDDFEARLNRSFEEGSCLAFPNNLWQTVKDHIGNMVHVMEPDGKWAWKQKGRLRKVDYRDTMIYNFALFQIMCLSDHVKSKVKKVEKSNENVKKKLNSLVS